jgi:hypothetical protein
MYEPAALNIVHTISVMIMKEDFGVILLQIKTKDGDLLLVRISYEKKLGY